MGLELITLFIIVSAAFVAPILSALIPKKIIPETVFLLIFGMVLGPNVLGLAKADIAIELFSDLGLAFLFLLAGYEINPKKMLGKTGRHGLYTWIITLGIAICIALMIPAAHDNFLGWLAAAIALTTTAFGTLVPILHDRGIADTKLGDVIVAYGTWGELGPIFAIAIMLSTRNTVLTLSILGAFLLIAIISAVIPKRIWRKSDRLTRFLSNNSDTNAQMTIRGVMVLVVGLVALSAILDLDLVLGAFAAGFVLRYLLPKGDKGLEAKLNGIGYGFFIPLFFIVSGMGINPQAVFQYPHLMILFIIALLLVRGLPIFISLKIHPETRSLGTRNIFTAAMYCTTALPLIVAVTSIATNMGTMSADMASLLVSAGGTTVLLMPLIASLTYKAMKE